MLNALKKLWMLLTPKERTLSVFILGMMILAAGLEIVGIGLIVPLLGLLAQPELAEQSRLILRLKNLLAPTADASQFILVLCVAIILLFLAKNLFLAVQAYCHARFVFGMGSRLGHRLYDKYLHAPYSFHLERNSGHLLGSLNLTSSICHGLMLPGMILLTETVIVTVILLVLLVLEPLVTLCLFLLIAGFAVVFYFPLRRCNYILGRDFQREEQAVNQLALQGLKGIKESKIRNVEDYFSNEYARHQCTRGRILAAQNFLGNLPRFAIEALVVSLGLGTLALLLLFDMAIGSIILTLSLLAVALVRLMPSFSRMQYSIASIRQHQALLEEYYHEAMELPSEDKTPKRPDLPFNDRISISGLGFRYAPAAPAVLSGFDLEIPKNSAVAFVGPTGCGKTTLVDLLLGLLKPTTGAILVDNINIEENLPAWQTRIGYVPQSIFLLDDSVRANVAFGMPRVEIDDDRVRACLRTAQILEFVEGLPDGLDARVGDNGIRISGGQRQRLGIARALYHNPEILVLDEATSALDTDTEKAFVDALRTLRGKLTIIMVAHRMSTVENCDRVVSINDITSVQ